MKKRFVYFFITVLLIISFFLSQEIKAQSFIFPVTDLTATYDEISGQITLHWTGPYGDPDNPNNYDLRYSTFSSSGMLIETWWKSAISVSLPFAPSPGIPEHYSISGLEPGTYHFRLVSCDTTLPTGCPPIDFPGVSDVSNEAIGTVPAGTGAPEAITDLTVYKPAEESTGGYWSIYVSWTAPMVTVGGGAAGGPTFDNVSGYDIRYNTEIITDANWLSSTPASAAGSLTPKDFGELERFPVSPLAADTTYWVAIKSDYLGTESNLSNVVADTTSTESGDMPPPPPDGGTTLPDTVTNFGATPIDSGSVLLVWSTSANVDYYHIYRSTYNITASNLSSAYYLGQVAGANTATQSMTVSGLQPSTTYYFAIRAYNEAGFSDLSVISCITLASATIPPADEPPADEEPADEEPADEPPADEEPAVSYGAISGNVQDQKGNFLNNIYGWVFVEKLEAAGFEPLEFGGPVENGTFSFDVPVGSYKLNIHLPLNSNYTPGSPIYIDIGANEIKNVTLTVLQNMGMIWGYLKDKLGNIITGVPADIFVTGENGAWQGASLNISTGAYSIKVSPGTWYLGFHLEPDNGYIAPSLYQEPIVITADETVVRDIPVVKVDSVISGTVTDYNGQPLSDVLVSADSLSFTAAGNENLFSIEGTTDTNGDFKLLVPQGEYYVHAFLSSEHGFINPPEQKIFVSPAKSGIVNLVFRKKDSILSGFVYLNYSGTSAFVWAWSEKGGYSETRADSTGSYGLQLSKNDVWHIQAAKRVNDVVYRSKEVIVDVGGLNQVFRNLTLEKTIIEIPNSVSVTAEADKSQLISTEGGVKVYMPPASLVPGGSVTLTITPDIETSSSPLFRVVGLAYKIEAKDMAGRTINLLGSDISIMLPFTMEQIISAKVNIDDLRMAFWDESIGYWREISDSAVDKTNSLVVGTTSHLTRFAIVSPADVTPPEAPTSIAVINAEPGTLLISWKNPERDFHHTKIYVSLTEQVLGNIKFNDIFSTSQKDINLEDGVIYFYTVRAVDPAGNESQNTRQVFAVAKGKFVPEEKDENGDLSPTVTGGSLISPSLFYIFLNLFLRFITGNSLSIPSL